MPKVLLALMLALAIGACSAGRDKAAAEAAVAEFHTMVAAERYHDIYAGATDEFRRASPEEAATRLFRAVHDRLGAVQNAERGNWRVNFASDGTVVNLSYATQFATGRGTEDFVFRIDGGAARLLRYHINSMELVAGPSATAEPEPEREGGKEP